LPVAKRRLSGLRTDAIGFLRGTWALLIWPNHTLDLGDDNLDALLEGNLAFKGFLVKDLLKKSGY